MLAIFALRLATGLIAVLLLLNPSQVNPRFYRTHFLTALGLAGLALIFLWDAADAPLAWALGAASGLALLGSIVWMLEGVPLGRMLIVLTGLALAAALGLARWSDFQRAETDPADSRSGLPSRTSVGLARQAGPTVEQGDLAWLLADDYSSAALLGSATTAMLIGHSYLIAPAMSLIPLLRLLKALFASTLVRLALAGAGLWYWTGEASLVNLETALWLVPRWGLGFAGPLVLGWMAWETARIRSTQSATGILYVVVIFCFLGELTGQLLLARCGIPV
jgi:hypothetical protein